MRPWPRAFISALYLLSNCVLLHATEANFWGDRRKVLQATQVASLPASMVNMPLPQAFSSSLPKQIQREIPKNQEQRLTPILKALSSNYGTVRRVSMPTKGQLSSKIVVHIQDVHLNAEAQENIGKTISGLMNKKSVGLIGLEGSFAPINLETVRAFEDKRATEIVAEYLLRENRISGAIHAAYIHPNEIPVIVGIDDKTHYDSNIQAYQSSLSRKEADTKKLATLSVEMKKMKSSLNPNLSAFHAQVLAHQEGNLPFGEYIQILAKQVPEHSSAIDVFLEAYAMEKSLNFPRVESERTALLSQLIPKLSKAETDELLSTSMAFRLGNINQTDFYSYLSRVCREKKTPLSQFKAMNAYVQYVLLSDAIHPEKLMRDVAKLEDEAYSSLARTPSEMKWVKESKHLLLAGKLLDFALTPDEWSNYKEGKSQIAGLDLSAYETFYTEAEARNEAMTSNLLNAMDRENARVAVLVTGGFHSPGIDQLMENAGVATLTFVPKISKVEAENGTPEYLSVFAQAKTPLDQLFSGEKLFVSPNPNGAVPAVISALQQATSQKLANPDGPNSATVAGNSGELTIQFAAGPNIETVKYSPLLDPMGRILRFVTSAIKSWKSATALPTLAQIKTGNQLRTPPDVLERVKNWPDSAVKNDGIRKKLKALFKAPKNKGLEILVVQGENGEAALGGNQMARYYDESDRNNPHAVIVIEQKFISLTLNANHSDPILQKAAERIFMERFFHELSHGNTALDLENEILEETLVMRNIDWELWAYAGGFNYPGIYSLLNEALPLESSAHISGAWKYKQFKRIWEEIRTLEPDQKDTYLIRELKKMATNVVGENPTPGAKSWGAPAQAAGQGFNAWRKGRTDEILVSFDDKTAPIRISHYEAVRDLDKGILKLDGIDSKTKKLLIVKDNKTAPMASREAYEKYLQDQRETEKGPVAFHGSKEVVEITLKDALRDEETGFLMFDDKNNSGKFYLDPIASTKKKLEREDRRNIMKRFLEKVVTGAKKRGTPNEKMFPVRHPFQASPFTSINAFQALQLFEEGLIAPRNMDETQFTPNKSGDNLAAMSNWRSDTGVPYYEAPFQALALEFVVTSHSPEKFNEKIEEMVTEYFGANTILSMGIPVFEVLGKFRATETTLTQSKEQFQARVIQADMAAGKLKPKFKKDGSFEGVVLKDMTIDQYYAYRNRQGAIETAKKILLDKQKSSETVDVLTSDKKTVKVPSEEAVRLFQSGHLELSEKDPSKPGKDIVLNWGKTEAELITVRNLEKLKKVAAEKPGEDVRVGGPTGVKMTLAELMVAMVQDKAVVVDNKGAPVFDAKTKPADYEKLLKDRRTQAEYEKKLDGKDPIFLTNPSGVGQNFPAEDVKRAYQDKKVIFDPNGKKFVFAPGVTGPMLVDYFNYIRAQKALLAKTSEMETSNSKKIKDGYGDQVSYFYATGSSANSFAQGAVFIRSFDEVRKGFSDGRFGYDPKQPDQLKALATKADYQKYLDAVKSGTTLNTVIGNRGWLSYLVTYTGAKYIYEHATAALARMLGYTVESVQVSRTVGQVTMDGQSAAVTVVGPLTSLLVGVMFSVAGTWAAFLDTDAFTKVVVVGLSMLVGAIPNLLMAANIALVDVPGSRGNEILSMVLEYRQRRAERQGQLDELAQIFSDALAQNNGGRLDAALLARIQSVPISLDQISGKQRGDGSVLSNKEKAYVEQKAGELARGKAMQINSSSFAAMVTLLSQLGAAWLGTSTKLDANRSMALTFSDEQSATDQLGELRKALGENNRMVIALVSSDQRRDELEYWTSEKTSIRYFSPRDGYVAGASFDLNNILDYVINKQGMSREDINNTTFATPDGEFQAEWIPDMNLLQTLSSQGYDIRLQQRAILLGSLPVASLNVSNVLELMRHIAKFA